MFSFTTILKDPHCIHSDGDIKLLALCHTQKKLGIKS